MPKDVWKTRIKPIKNVNERVATILDLIREGSQDKEIIKVGSMLMTRRKRGGQWVVKEKDWENEVRTVWDYVRGNVRYTLDPWTIDLYQRARRTLQLRKGDCDDLVILSGAILSNLGYPIKIIIIDTTGDWNHIYLRVGIPPENPTKWISFDAAATEEGRLGFEYPSSIVRREKVFDDLSGISSFAGDLSFDWWHAGLVMALIFILGKYL